MSLLQQVCNSSPRLVMFDLDGTLVDSVPDLAFAVDAMLRDLGLPVAGIESIRHWVGNGAVMLVKRAISGQMVPEAIDPTLYEKAHALFLTHYQQVNGRKSSLYPKVSETLIKLRNSTDYLALITNKPEQFTQALLDYHCLPEFDLVICGDTLATKKPSPDQLLHCMKTLNCGAEESVMVGDSVSDIRAAQAANVPVICVEYGYNQGEDLSTYQPDRLIQAFNHLL